jgi:hypothetical protein
MNTFTKIVDEDRRLTILLLLSESPDYKANHFLLQTALDGFGHTVSVDRLKSDLAWLAEQGLVVQHDTAGVQVPQLTDRGLDVAQGRVVVPGVKRPRP